MSLNPSIDRRAFISGSLANPDRRDRARRRDRQHPGAGAAGASRRGRGAIAALEGCEIHARDPSGKLVVVIEAATSGAIGSTLNTIALLPDVFSAALVFHATDGA